MGTSASKNVHNVRAFMEDSQRSKDTINCIDDDSQEFNIQSTSQQQSAPKWWKLQKYRNNNGHKRLVPNSNDSIVLFKEYLNSLSNASLIKLFQIYSKAEVEYIEWRKCESSRFIGNTIEQDLENLLDYKYNCDINLNINSVASFPAHISILKQRSSYFRALLFNWEERHNHVRFCGGSNDLPTNLDRNCQYRRDDQTTEYGYPHHRFKEPSQDQDRYSSYRTSKELKSHYERKLLSVDLNVGSTNIHSFSKVLRYLYTGVEEEQCRDVVTGSGSVIHGDENRIVIGINPGKNSLKMDLNEMLTNGSYTDLMLMWRCTKMNSEYIYPCHKSVLSARSPFFRNLLSRSMHQNELEIDENIIQKKYALLLLTCLYTDVLDLSLIGKHNTQQLVVEDREGNDLAADGTYKSYFETITQIYQIGRFLEFDLLCNQCENLITNNILNNSNPVNNMDGGLVLKILKWSSEAFGSKYVQRQCIQYILFNYNEFVKSNSLLQGISEEIMEVLISSNYIQASECEILSTLIRWGNLQLNSSCIMTDLGGQRGIQRNERNAKLCHFLRPFLKWIRFEQILNRNVLNQCLMNNLFGSLGEVIESELKLNFLTRPRYIQTFHNEIKAALFSTQNSFVQTPSASTATCIPDTLYMLDSSNASTSTVCVGGAAMVDNNIVIEPELLAAMKQREQKLCSQNKEADLSICRQYIRLRIVREFGFPDSTVQILNGMNQSESNWNDTSPSTSLSNRMPDVAIVDSSSNGGGHVSIHSTSTEAPSQKENVEGLIDLDLGDGANSTQYLSNAIPTSSKSSSLGKINHFRVDICPSASGSLRSSREHDDPGRKDKKFHRVHRFP